jgi:hypothetical protein
MVADFISADHGWLRSPDGKESARILFRAGKARDGYFTNENIVAHAEKAMDILEKYYPHEDHVFIFDNATTHLKHASDALSACKMPKCPSATWGITVTTKDSNGKVVIGADGKPLKKKFVWLMQSFPMETHNHFIFLMDMKRLDGLKAWLRFLLKGAMPMHHNSGRSAKTSSVQKDILIVAAGG